MTAVLLAFTVSVVSCSGDSIDQGLALENLPQGSLLATMVLMNSDAGRYPVPGGSGFLTVTQVTGSSISISWARATDDSTDYQYLRYRVVISTSNNIGTPGAALANGDIVTDWANNYTTAQATSLTNGTIYYLNVLVLDLDGYISAYSVVSAATLRNSVTLFSAGRYTGAMIPPTVSSARGSLDQMCISARQSLYPAMSCSSVRAFISITNSDCIANMPSNYGLPTSLAFMGPTGTIIANTWADLMDGSIPINLRDADIASQEWWSGSNASGGASPDNCASWTGYASSVINGAAGAHNKTDSQWIYDSSRNCSNLLHLLCGCW